MNMFHLSGFGGFLAGRILTKLKHVAYGLRLPLPTIFLVAVWGVSHIVLAQTPVSTPGFTAAVTVVPEIAPAGVARTLIVSGVWPNGCIPRGASLSTQDVGPRQFVVITLQRAPESVCTLATERFSFSLTFTPAVAATQPIIIQTDGGVRGGEGSIVTTSAATIAPLIPIITVVPDVDTPGRARTVVITGQYFAGCPFAPPTLDGQAGILLGGVVIRMDPVQTLAPCNSNSILPYRFEIPYTPMAAGTQRVVVASASGTIRSESRIRTAAGQGRTRAVGDVTGLWYDPATDGSGLQLTHNFAGTDVVFGTWYLYDISGLARWLSIQGVVWQTGGTSFTGDLYQSGLDFPFQIICDPVPCLSIIGPRPMQGITKIGTVRFTFTGLGPYSDTPPQAVAEAFTVGGVLRFTSNISRIGL